MCCAHGRAAQGEAWSKATHPPPPNPADADDARPLDGGQQGRLKGLAMYWARIHAEAGRSAREVKNYRLQRMEHGGRCVFWRGWACIGLELMSTTTTSTITTTTTTSLLLLLLLLLHYYYYYNYYYSTKKD